MYNAAGNHLHIVGLTLGHILCVHFGNESLVYLQNNIVNSGQDFLYYIKSPLLHSLSHYGVVCVVECLFGNFKSLFERKTLVIYKYSYKLGDRYDGDSNLFVQLFNVVSCRLVLLHNIGKRSRTEEILLLEAENLALSCIVIRIKHSRNILSLYLLYTCVYIVLCIELEKIESIHRLSLP